MVSIFETFENNPKGIELRDTDNTFCFQMVKSKFLPFKVRAKKAFELLKLILSNQSVALQFSEDEQSCYEVSDGSFWERYTRAWTEFAFTLVGENVVLIDKGI